MQEHQIDLVVEVLLLKLPYVFLEPLCVLILLLSCICDRVGPGSLQLHGEEICDVKGVPQWFLALFTWRRKGLCAYTRQLLFFNTIR